MAVEQEKKRLQDIAVDSWYGRNPEVRTSEYSGEIFSRFIRGESLLELGPAEGMMTPTLEPLVKQLTLVEGAQKFCESLRERHPRAEVIHALFEEFKPERRFDNIVMGHVLEHVEDAVAILRLARGWLAPGGRVFAAVPNARSLHRQAAVIMGLLKAEDALSDNDRHHGHRRIYNPELFRNHFHAACLKVVVFGGYWLKSVSNGQIEKSWTPEMLSAFMALGERYPDIAGEIYIVAEAGEDK